MGRIEVVSAPGVPVAEPFLLRLAGWTEERYFAEAPEDRLWEFEKGELLVHSPATPRHQEIVGILAFLLRGYAEERGLGKVFTGPAVLRLREGVAKEPDIFVILNNRMENIAPTRVEGPADLVVEVASAGTRSYDMGEKAGVYQEGEVQEYWVVDPDRRAVVVHRIPGWQVTTHTQGRLPSSALRGFWIEVDWLWPDPQPAALPCLQRILEHLSPPGARELPRA